MPFVRVHGRLELSHSVIISNGVVFCGGKGNNVETDTLDLRLVIKLKVYHLLWCPIQNGMYLAWVSAPSIVDSVAIPLNRL